MMKKISISVFLPGSPEQIYEAWLDARQHAEFVGADARIEPFAEGTFNIWNGYITGRNILLQPYSCIIQAWRTTDFHPDSPASRLEIRLRKEKNGTLFHIVHSDIPEDLVETIRHGWFDYYIEPMTDYFARINQGTRLE